MTDMAITKLDVLDGFKTLKICVAYRYQGRLIYEFPESLSVLEQCVPEYIEMSGWQEDITGVTSLEDLPANARAYLSKIEEITGVKQCLVAVGAKRNQTIVNCELFD